LQHSYAEVRSPADLRLKPARSDYVTQPTRIIEKKLAPQEVFDDSATIEIGEAG
jgi:hypothetical protein